MRRPGIKLGGVPGRVVFLDGKGFYVVFQVGSVLLTNYSTESGEQLENGDKLFSQRG